MTLSKRIILIIITTFTVLLSIIAVTSNLILLSSYSTLEKNEIISHVNNISNQIEDKLKQLQLTALEISEELHENGALSHSSSWASNMKFVDSTMRSHGLDIIAAYSSSGNLITITGYDCEKEKLVTVSPERKAALTALVSKIILQPSATQGLVTIDGIPLMMAYTFVKSNEGKSLGIVLTGWFVDSIAMQRIFRTSGAHVELYNLAAPLAPEVAKVAETIINGTEPIYVATHDSKSIAGYFLLKDVFKKPSFIVGTSEKRVLYEHGKKTIAYIFAALFVVVTILCVVMLMFIKGSILNHLLSLTTKVEHITESCDITSRLPLSKYNDELKTLAVSINSMLQSLETSENNLRESEERYRMLFERAPDAIIIIGMEGDEKGVVIAANQAAAEQHGYTIDELHKISIYDLNTAETNRIAGDIFAGVAAGDWVTAEVWHQKKDGSQFPVEIHAGLIKIAGKNYVLGFDRDITQRKIAEEADHLYLEQISRLNDELSLKASELTEVNSELETFNYSVSHDMRGPLTRISGYCQLLLDNEKQLEPDVREYITRIYESETWLNDMVDALIQLASLKRVELVSAKVNLSLIADEVLKELYLEHPERNVKIIVQPDVIVYGDYRLLKIVMINLLNNAWKYSSEKSEAIIEFGVEQAEIIPVYYVRDNGAGFDMKNINKLFSVFTRLHSSSQFEGTGIGCATAKRIILRHGGKIWAEAEPEVGATFFFTLPSNLNSHNNNNI